MQICVHLGFREFGSLYCILSCVLPIIIIALPWELFLSVLR